MADNIRLEVVTPEKILASEDAEIVMAPGTLGEFGVLSGHTPFLTTLKLGTVRYKDAKGDERCIFISGGFAEALPDKVTILAETAERRCDIDLDRAKSALDRARKRIQKEATDDMDYTRAKSALDRALQRIKLSESRQRRAS
jgi:F-type H+-transporting ATPase subunit epsilon